MKRQNIRTLSLVVITLTYLLIGAAVFDYVESENERIQIEHLNNAIGDFQLKHKMNDSDMSALLDLVIQKKPHNAGYQWKFIGSLYFCTVVITLIGYGHSTPRTISGKLFCILYSLVGIIVALIMFQSVGERLNSLIAFLLRKVKRKLKLKNQDVGLLDLITVEATLSFTIVCIASYVFTKHEKWSYFDSLYYCFITLTTIGFGDMVPMQSDGMLNNNIGYACFTIIFILTGLVTLASTMNLLVLRLATINAEEQVKLEAEAAEAKRQVVHLEGDVITGANGRLLISQEKPEQCDAISVCSCTCLDHKLFHKTKFKNRANRSVCYNKNGEIETFKSNEKLSKKFCINCNCIKSSYTSDNDNENFTLSASNYVLKT